MEEGIRSRTCEEELKTFDYLKSRPEIGDEGKEKEQLVDDTGNDK